MGHTTNRVRQGRCVPRQVQHSPVAEEETHLLLMEKRGTPNSGDPATAAPRRVI